MPEENLSIMERILFGDNQFFGVNHLSEQKGRESQNKFKNTSKIMEILDFNLEIGINTFMCTTYERVGEICEIVRNDPMKYSSFQIYPCMPYAHKYANAITEHGIVGMLKEYLTGSILKSVTKGTLSLARGDYLSMMKLLIDMEMAMFKGINTGVIFLQNVVTDLVLGLGMYEFLIEYGVYVREKYNAEPGYITMNLPLLLNALESKGVENPIICSSINKIDYRMSGGIQLYEEFLKTRKFRPIAMQVLAAGALSPEEAFNYVCSLPKIESILFGASSKEHILQSKNLIEKYSKSNT